MELGQPFIIFEISDPSDVEDKISLHQATVLFPADTRFLSFHLVCHRCSVLAQSSLRQGNSVANASISCLSSAVKMTCDFVCCLSVVLAG